MSSFNNIQSQRLDREHETFEDGNYLEIDEVEVREDQMTMDLITDDEFFRLTIPMTPGNIRVLKKQLRASGDCFEGETDKRGRFNFGVQHSEKFLDVAILHESDLEDG